MGEVEAEANPKQRTRGEAEDGRLQEEVGQGRAQPPFFFR